MRTLCPNMDREDALDTVLEIPVPEETSPHAPPRRHLAAARSGRFRCRTVKAWVRSHIDHHRRAMPASHTGAADQLQLMLGVIGAPLVPQPVEARKAMAKQDIKEEPLEVSTAKYIVEQYIAAAGGEAALSAATSMYAMGKVAMKSCDDKKKVGARGREEVGGFVVWQKRPELWCVELVVSGSKLSAGSDGKVAWRQTPWQQPHSSRGPPRPLRRCIQGLDPKSTADLFSNAVWIGEKSIDGDECFVLRVDANCAVLRARSTASVEVVRHAVWGYFSQRTGLLVHLEDSHLLRIQGANKKQSVYWETSMESSISDYRPVDGINVAHAGRTVVSIFRFGSTGDDDDSAERTSLRMEESWSIEEVDFNIVGLSMDCFLPPRNLKEEDDHNKATATSNKKDSDIEVEVEVKGGVRAPAAKVPGVTGNWFGPAKVVAVDTDSDELELTSQQENKKLYRMDRC